MIRPRQFAIGHQSHSLWLIWLNHKKLKELCRISKFTSSISTGIYYYYLFEGKPMDNLGYFGEGERGSMLLGVRFENSDSNSINYVRISGLEI